MKIRGMNAAIVHLSSTKDTIVARVSNVGQGGEQCDRTCNAPRDRSRRIMAKRSNFDGVIPKGEVCLH